MTDDNDRAAKERRKRNVVLALALCTFGILIYLMSVVKFGQYFGH